MNLDSILSEVQHAQFLFKSQLERLASNGGFSIETYQRILTMQTHLTKGVQRHFYSIAGNERFSGKTAFRKFLVQFANEEEHHYLIAARDLKKLNLEVLPCPLDVKLWWAYYDSIIECSPLLRLGATCILENISKSAAPLIKQLLSAAPFLDESNTQFIRIHQHEELPHGEQILDAIKDAQFSPDEIMQLSQGAKTATILYLRMSDWAFFGSVNKMSA